MKVYPLTVLCAMLVFAPFLRGSALTQEAPNSARENSQSLVQATREFLGTWLLKREVDRAQAWFSEVAYRHNSILNAECSGFTATRLATEAGRRSAVTAFLRDSLPDTPAKVLTDVVSAKATAELARKLGKRVVNDQAKDGFLVTKMDRNDRGLRGAKYEQLRSNLPATFDVTVLAFDTGEGYFFWLKEPAGWRIVHANMSCN